MPLFHRLSSAAQYGLATGFHQAFQHVLQVPVSFAQAQAVLAQTAGHTDWEEFHRYPGRDHMSLNPEAMSAHTLKQLVKGLRKALVSVLDQALPQHQAQEILARALGYPHWFALTQKTEAPRPMVPPPPADPYAEEGGYSEEHKAAVAYLLAIQDDGRSDTSHPPTRNLSARAATALAEAFDLAARAGAVGLCLTLLDSGDEDTSSGDLQLNLKVIQANGKSNSFCPEELADLGAHGEALRAKNKAFDLTAYGLAPNVSPGHLATQMETWETEYWDLAIQEPTRWLPVLNRSLAAADREHWIAMVAGVAPTPTRRPARRRSRR